MYQSTTIVGNVGRDAEMRYTPAGVAVTSFSIAVNRRWNDANCQAQEQVTWFRVTCWRKLAEIAGQYVKKGKLVLVEGDIEGNAYINRAGAAVGTLELTANTLKFLSASPHAEAGEPALNEPTAPDDGIPF